MLKKLLAGTAVAIVGLSFAHNAAAECNGIYIAGRAGLANPKIGDKELSATDKKLNIEKNVFMLSGALGYRYEYVRAEVEYIWRNTNKDKNNETIDIPGIGAVTDSSTAEFSYDTYMFNMYYDLSPNTWFTPYLSAGIGMTSLEYNFVYNNNIGNKTSSEKKDNLTWSVGAGLSAKMTNRVNLDLGYRYFDMGKLGEAKITNHEIYAGARYVF